MRKYLTITLASLAGLFALGWVTSYFWFVAVSVALPAAMDSDQLSMGQMAGRISFEASATTGANSPANWQGRTGVDVASARQVGRQLNSTPAPMPSVGELPYFDWGSVSATHSNGWTMHLSSLTFPHAVPALLLSLWPAWVLLQRWRHRHSPGHCAHCDYDLRSMPEAATCPECGKPADNAGRQPA